MRWGTYWFCQLPHYTKLPAPIISHKIWLRSNPTTPCVVWYMWLIIEWPWMSHSQSYIVSRLNKFAMRTVLCRHLQCRRLHLTLEGFIISFNILAVTVCCGSRIIPQHEPCPPKEGTFFVCLLRRNYNTHHMSRDYYHSPLELGEELISSIALPCQLIQVAFVLFPESLLSDKIFDIWVLYM